MISAIIVDDEAMARTSLRFLLQKTGKVDVLAEYDRPMDAARFMEKKHVDVLFLDIQMPGINGIEFLQLVPTKANVVLVSSDPSYGPDAFQLEVANYLLKPLSYSKLLACIERLELALKKEDERHYITIKVDGELHRLASDEISVIMTMDDYLKLTLRNGKTHITHSSLKQFLKTVPEYIVQIHQSYAVNINDVEKLRNHDLVIGGNCFPVSRSRKSFVRDQLDHLF